MKIINKNLNDIEKNNMHAGKYAILIILLSSCMFIEACSCTCAPRRARTLSDGSAERGTILSASKVSAENFTGAFAAYLGELRAIENQSKMKALKQISVEQKSAKIAFSRGMEDKNSLLDDPSGKFKELEPLVKENKVDEIIAVLHRIAHENDGDRPVVMEANRKLSLCYYLTGDHIKCSGHMAKYNALLEDEVRHEDEINEQVIKSFKDDIDY
ncbi:MAG: hypothetical protein A2008_09580 [Candidatus Wallbacteria bacterium GWC2_49_35]|uniref:Uncharacterized protein n=1 Tax=Candidatus Wallbacteria bacterium GWC2_49_35 TaxID=1817813 RepID=A0A1F7X1W0_9BACT|nr:MAG: hypothetical protein A2008_09580 [Candidatus Wallbacteria bacterium GWC2_49_35]HBC74022.1 hypothetical protein [Candidatus Wallbacteria bacterium]